MFGKLRLNRKKKLLRKIQNDLFVNKLNFSEMENKYINNNNLFDKISNYAFIDVSCLNLPSSINERLELAIEDSIENIPMCSNNIENLEMIRVKTEMRFIRFEMKQLINKTHYENDRYSFEAMIYEMEQLKKGSLTIDEHNSIRDLSKEDISNISIKKN